MPGPFVSEMSLGILADQREDEPFSDTHSSTAGYLVSSRVVTDLDLRLQNGKVSSISTTVPGPPLRFLMFRPEMSDLGTETPSVYTYTVRTCFLSNHQIKGSITVSESQR